MALNVSGTEVASGIADPMIMISVIGTIFGIFVIAFIIYAIIQSTK